MDSKISIESIVPNPVQPRKDFDPEKLQELADNIRAVGLKQPIEVYPLKDGSQRYQIVDGERCWRACKLIPLDEVPVIVREDIKSKEEAALQSFIVNDQRANYSPVDKEAYIYHLYKNTGLSTRKLAAKLGVHHSSIDHYLEAYRFRQKIPSAYQGRQSLQLTHTALKNTAMIKDDNLRIKVLQAIQDKKIKQDYDSIAQIAGLLIKVPRQVQEAYFLGLFDTTVVAEFAREIEGHDWDIRWGKILAKVFTEKIPYELKKDVLKHYPFLQAAVIPKIMEALLEDEEERKNAELEQYIKDHPERSEKDIRHSSKIQLKEWKDEWRAFAQGTLIEFKKKYAKDAENYRSSADRFWVDVFYWMTKLQAIIKTKGLDEDLRIAIIDATYNHELLELLKARGDTETARKIGKKIDEIETTTDDDNDNDNDNDDDDGADLIAEERRNEKAVKQNAEIVKMMGVADNNND